MDFDPKEYLIPEKWLMAEAADRDFGLQELSRALAERLHIPRPEVHYVEFENPNTHGGTEKDRPKHLFIEKSDLISSDPYRAIHTVAHEIFHAYQIHCMNNPEQHPEVPLPKIEEWRGNSENYKSSETGQTKYSKQSIERDADQFADRVIREMYTEREAEHAREPVKVPQQLAEDAKRDARIAELRSGDPRIIAEEKALAQEQSREAARLNKQLDKNIETELKAREQAISAQKREDDKEDERIRAERHTQDEARSHSSGLSELASRVLDKISPSRVSRRQEESERIEARRRAEDAARTAARSERDAGLDIGALRQRQQKARSTATDALGKKYEQHRRELRDFQLDRHDREQAQTRETARTPARTITEHTRGGRRDDEGRGR